jgi:hypothetical protein
LERKALIEVKPERLHAGLVKVRRIGIGAGLLTSDGGRNRGNEHGGMIKLFMKSICGAIGTIIARVHFEIQLQLSSN